jgi:hypothetical protein
MLYKVSASERWYNYEKRFGEEGSKHELSDSEVIDIIIKFGRVTIKETSGSYRELCFRNFYDSPGF